MGLLQSLIWYFTSVPTKISVQKISDSSKKLSIGIKLKMQRLQKQIINLEDKLIKMVKSQKRDKFVQNIKIDDLILQSIKFGVYQQLLYCVQRIGYEAYSIATDLSTVSDQCLSSIYSIVHLYRDFELNELIDLKEFIPEPYPVIRMEKLHSNIRKFLQYKKPTEYQRNIYVLELIKRQQGKISLIQLNQANHGYNDYPVQQDSNLPVNSAQLYARSASYQIDEEQQQYPECLL